MDKRYKGLIWTNHALDRLKERGISQGDAWATWNRADQTRKGTSPNSWVYYRTFGDTKIEVVAKKNENNEWLVLSVWSKKVFSSEVEKKRPSFWKNIIDIFFG